MTTHRLPLTLTRQLTRQLSSSSPICAASRSLSETTRLAASFSLSRHAKQLGVYKNEVGFCQMMRSFSSTPMVAADAKPSEVTTDGGGPASPKVEAIFQKILYLDMVELHLVTELINEKLGITMSAAARARMAAGGNGGVGGGANAAEKEEVKEEKTIFDLRLEGFDPKTKIKVIKEVRVITGLGLKDAKELVEGAPKVLKKDIKKEEAEELKKKLEALGAVVGIV